MNLIGKIGLVTLVLIVNVTSFFPSTAWAASSPCAPDDPKPTKLETRLGTITIDNDIVAVGQPLTIVVKNLADAQSVKISPPAGTEVIDYLPKTFPGIQISQGTWTAGSTPVPAGEYTLIVKPTRWTSGKWEHIDYSITNTQGIGQGYDSYFAYYDSYPFTIALDDRNQAAQTTKQVVRKVTVNAPAGIKVNLSTNKGTIGASVAEKRGTQATITANNNGKATFFLTANEGDKVKLTASSPDTCTNSPVTQEFKLGRSDVARSYTGSWLTNYWWVILILILFLGAVVYWWQRRRRQLPPTPPTNPPTLPPSNPVPPPTLPTPDASPTTPESPPTISVGS